MDRWRLPFSGSANGFAEEEGSIGTIDILISSIHPCVRPSTHPSIHPCIISLTATLRGFANLDPKHHMNPGLLLLLDLHFPFLPSSARLSLYLFVVHFLSRPLRHSWICNKNSCNVIYQCPFESLSRLPWFYLSPRSNSSLLFFFFSFSFWGNTNRNLHSADTPPFIDLSFPAPHVILNPPLLSFLPLLFFF